MSCAHHSLTHSLTVQLLFSPANNGERKNNNQRWTKKKKKATTGQRQLTHPTHPPPQNHNSEISKYSLKWNKFGSDRKRHTTMRKEGKRERKVRERERRERESKVWRRLDLLLCVCASQCPESRETGETTRPKRDGEAEKRGLKRKDCEM